jgi:hypothetical protein
MRKSIAAVSLAAVSIAGLGAGFALGVPGVSSAQTSSTTPAAASGSAPAASPAADRATHIADALKPLVTDGTITQAQADKVSAALQAAMPAGGKGGRGPGGDMGRGGPRGGASLGVVATAIGITEADLRTALHGGQTIAQVAQAHNVTADAVIAALVADQQSRLDKAVAAGTITQAQADQRKADATTRFTDMVNNAAPIGGRGHGPMGAAGSTSTTTA